MKPFPSELRYVFLGENNTWPIVIDSSISKQEEEKVLIVLRKYKEAMGWTIFDLEMINPMAYTNHNDSGDIYIIDVAMEEDNMSCKDKIREMPTKI